MTDPIKIAQERFAQKFNCSQAVFSAFAPKFGISDETAFKLASPFGGGTALQGHVCGAVTGAMMIVGLARGSSDPKDKETVYRMGQEFIKRFETRHGTVLCRELTGFDFQNPEEYQAAKDQGVATKVCPEFVQSAAVILSKILDE